MKVLSKLRELAPGKLIKLNASSQQTHGSFKRIMELKGTAYMLIASI